VARNADETEKLPNEKAMCQSIPAVILDKNTTVCGISFKEQWFIAKLRFSVRTRGHVLNITC
jgi:hypothetical protein